MPFLPVRSGLARLLQLRNAVAEPFAFDRTSLERCIMNPTRPYHWLCLLAAIVFEVVGTTVMKLSFGWSFAHAALAGLVLMWIAIGLSYYSLAKATTGLPVGVAFAFWEALGLALITLSSIYILDEPFSLQRLAGLLCALSGALLVHHGTVQDKDTSPDTNRNAG